MEPTWLIKERERERSNLAEECGWMRCWCAAKTICHLSRSTDRPTDRLDWVSSRSCCFDSGGTSSFDFNACHGIAPHTKAWPNSNRRRRSVLFFLHHHHGRRRRRREMRFSAWFDSINYQNAIFKTTNERTSISLSLSLQTLNFHPQECDVVNDR